jgi:hypothetical protein
MNATQKLNYFSEDDDRISKMDNMYLQERVNEIYEEWQCWEFEQNNKQVPAKIEILTPIFKHEEL